GNVGKPAVLNRVGCESPAIHSTAGKRVMSDTANPSMQDDSLPPMVLPGRAPAMNTVHRSEPAQASRIGQIVLVILLLLSLGLNRVFCCGGFFLLLFAGQFGEDRSDEGPPIYEKHWSGNKSAREKVAIVRIEGVLLDETMGFTNKQIEKAAKDSDVKA